MLLSGSMRSRNLARPDGEPWTIEKYGDVRFEESNSIVCFKYPEISLNVFFLVRYRFHVDKETMLAPQAFWRRELW